MRQLAGTLVAHLVGVALLLWLYAGDLALWARAQRAPVSALAEPPGLVLPVVGLLVAAAGVGLLAAGVVRRRGAAWRGYRLFPIGAIGLLFLDFGVLASLRVVTPSAERALVVAQLVADAASVSPEEGRVPTDPAAFEPLLARLGPVPWLVRGQRVPRWELEVRTCEGPAGDARGRAPGTLIYCATRDRARAWITVVGLPAGQRFGEAAVVSTDPAWVGAVVPRVRGDVDPGDPEDAEGLPTPPEVPDAGR